MRFSWLVLMLGLAGCRQCPSGQGIVAANPAPDEALALCRQSIERAREENSLSIATKGCSDLFSRESCHSALRAVNDQPSRDRWMTTLEICRATYCPVMARPTPALCGPEKSMIRRVLASDVRELTSAVLNYELGRRATVLEMLADPAPADAGDKLLFEAPMLVEFGLDGGALWMRVTSDEGTTLVEAPEELTLATRRWDSDGGVVVLVANKDVDFKNVKRVMNAVTEGGAHDIDFRSR